MNEEYSDLSINDIDYIIEDLVHNPKKTKIDYQYIDFESYEPKEPVKTYKKKNYFKDTHYGIHSSDFKEIMGNKDSKIVELQNKIKELMEENEELKIELKTFKAMEN